ncbi:unnamed protein product [Soboliphyme baturini]|uniref:Glutaredoxin domain-containing protein n=1 Tax=Soboliphyme baturini TaxID=241478 RepID=A0A183INH2_9BILA|nr:unnamed protein product [Soboliphyme baturini]
MSEGVKYYGLCSKVKVREHLVNLLNTSGLHIGLLKTPSVSGFEQPSSTGSEKFPPVFKEFDFLECEQDSVSESAESCFHWLSTLRPVAICNAADEDTSEAVTATANLQCDLSGLNSSSHASSESDISDEVLMLCLMLSHPRFLFTNQRSKRINKILIN